MKAAVLIEPKNIKIEERDTPQPKNNELLVKLKKCGICTLEQRLYRGDMKIFYPIIIGHEAAGEIVEVGKDVISDFEPGMRVALDLVTRCGECYYCRTDRSNMCINRFKKGQQVLGGFAEYIVVRGSQAFRIPDEMSMEEAAFSEPLSCCIRSLKKINLGLADDIMIIGMGTMGMLHLQAALCFGAARIFVSDPDEKRLELARTLGAYKTINPREEDVVETISNETEGRGIDSCVLTTASHEALGTAVRSLSKAGRLNIYTSYTDKPPLPMDANTLHRNEYLITGSEGRTESDFHQAVRLMGYKKIDVTPLISKVVTFDAVEEGIKAAMSADTYRVLLSHED
jgi:L-iditol 2-dehydrogenase